LLSRPQQSHPRADDHQRITRARQAAEALFTSKPPVSTAPVPDTAPADPSAHKPRVLPVIANRASPPAPPAAIHTEAIKAPARPETQTTVEFPRSHFPRIRNWVKYGMTAVQIAKIYGVAVSEIQRILRKA
jgi:hypothetical protein